MNRIADKGLSPDLFLIGIIMICPICEQEFEDNCVYCPFDGDKLETEEEFKERLRILDREETNEENRLERKKR